MSRTYRKSSWALTESEEHYVSKQVTCRENHRVRKNKEHYEADLENSEFNRQKNFEIAYAKAGEENNWGHMDVWERDYKNRNFCYYDWKKHCHVYQPVYADKYFYIDLTEEEKEKKAIARYRKQFRDGRNRQSGRNQMFKDLSNQLIRRETKKMIKKYFQYGEEEYDQPHFADWHGKQFIWSVW